MKQFRRSPRETIPVKLDADQREKQDSAVRKLKTSLATKFKESEKTPRKSLTEKIQQVARKTVQKLKEPTAFQKNYKMQ